MTPAAWSTSGFAAIARLVAARSGLAFPPSRIPSAEAAIRRAAARAGCDDVPTYERALSTEAVPFDELITELTIGETYFFREPAQFEVIQRRIVPEIRARRGVEHVLRVWSAGCASGEEPYSLAILFKEAGLAERVRVVATDISPAALAKARRGIYGPWSLRGQAAERVRPYLSPAGNGFALHGGVRRTVSLTPLNLTLDAHSAVAAGVWGMDLVLCRNVLIYFEPAAIGRVARQLFASMAEGGWLLTGPSDPPLAGEAAFETVTTEAGTMYRRPLAAAHPTPRPTSPPRAEPVAIAIAAGEARCDMPATDASEILAAAATALDDGDYARAVRLSRDLPGNVAACALHVRALANLDPVEAEQACSAAVALHALSPEMHYLRAVVLLDLGREDAAIDELRRVLYLDRSLAAAHFTLAAVLNGRGDRMGAWRAYRNARDLSAARPPDEMLRLVERASAGELAAAAAAEMTRLAGEAAPTAGAEGGIA